MAITGPVEFVGSGLLLMLLTGCGATSSGIEVSQPAINEQPIAVMKPQLDVDLHRPSKQPDRIVLTWTGDPARSQAVTWRTEASVGVGLAEVAVADENASFVKRARQLKAKTTPLHSNLSLAHYHSVEFAALSPRTKYAYRVGDGANWSEWFQFTTASDQTEPFSFVYFGDAQNEVKSLWSRVIRESFVNAPNARFLLHAGDLINHANNDAHWGEWFQAGGWLNGMIPSVPTPGNHEYVNIGIETLPPDATLPFNVNVKPTLSHHWRPQFALPEHGPPGLEETAYFLDYQGVRIVSLNSNEKHAEQAVWLDKVLAENPGRWCILTFHHPIYSSAKSRDNVKLRTAWQPLIDKHHVDLVLQGHDHTYARSGLTTAASIAASEPSNTEKKSDGDNANAEQLAPTVASARRVAGTVYVVSISGPKMYDLGRPVRVEFQRVAEDTQLFQVITIDGDELRYVARTATSQLYDAFTLKKRDGQPNELIEQVPDSPQRLRKPIKP